MDRGFALRLPAPRLASALGELANISIRTRVAGLGAVAVTGLLALGSIYFITNQAKTQGFAEHGAQSAKIASLRDFRAAIASARAAERDFLLRKQESSEADFSTAIGRGKKLLAQLTDGNTDTLAAADLAGMGAATRELERLFEITNRAMRELGSAGSQSARVVERTGAREGITKAVTGLKSKLPDEAWLPIERAIAATLVFEEIFRSSGADIARVEAERLLFETVVAVRAADLPPEDTSPVLDAITQFSQHIFQWNEKARLTSAAIQNNSNAFEILEAKIGGLDRHLGQLAREREEAYREQSRKADYLLAILAALVLLATVAFSIVIGRSISAPLRQLDGATKRLAEGDTRAEIPLSTLRNEIGSMARALLVFRDRLIERERLAAESAAESDRKLARQTEVEKQIVLFREAVGAVLAVVGARADESRTSARTLSEATASAERRTGQAAVASHQISSGAVQVAAAVEELATGVQAISQQTRMSSAKVDEMARAAAGTEETIRELALAAERIGAVIGMIKAVAEQTNLLSLNATIEAARAGEAGRGFAVVASEVKGLATQTGNSANEISVLVASMQEQTHAAVTSIEAMARLAHEAQSATATISSAIQEQQAVTAEIARSISQTSQGSTELAQNIDGVSFIIRETSHSATRALESSDDLAASAAHLRAAVDDFLAGVQSARS